MIRATLTLRGIANTERKYDRMQVVPVAQIVIIVGIFVLGLDDYRRLALLVVGVAVEEVVHYFDGLYLVKPGVTSWTFPCSIRYFKESCFITSSRRM